MTPAELEKLHKGIQKTKIMAPPTNCLSPIGEELIFKGLAARVEATFVTSSSRPPSVYRGQPFQVEVGLAYGGSLPADELIEGLPVRQPRSAAVPAVACAITKAVVTDRLALLRSVPVEGRAPRGPDDPLRAHRLGLGPLHVGEQGSRRALPRDHQGAAPGAPGVRARLGAHVRHHRRVQDELKKRSYIDKYLPAIAEALQDILALSDKQRDTTVANLKDVLEKSRKV
jgi:DNA topoisomerase-6 subunit B